MQQVDPKSTPNAFKPSPEQVQSEPHRSEKEPNQEYLPTSANVCENKRIKSAIKRTLPYSCLGSLGGNLRSAEQDCYPWNPLTTTPLHWAGYLPPTAVYRQMAYDSAGLHLAAPPIPWRCRYSSCRHPRCHDSAGIHLASQLVGQSVGRSFG